MKNSTPRLSFWEIWNMSFGFLGIQFGFALQGGNMSRIFQTLGAGTDDIPLLWIAAPLTGLLVQPIVGYMSDRTWSPRWGRRRPYFLFGAIFSSVALFFMPYSSALWMAAGFLWILDASINISMEPFRALVADKLPDDQRSFGFIVQTLIIGMGTWVASQLPAVVTWFGVENEAPYGEIPPSVYAAFAIGAVVFLGSILFTVFRTTEYPPEDMEAFERERDEQRGLLAGIREISVAIRAMPRVMWKLGLVQFCSWFAFFTMWSFATPALTEHVFQTPIETPACILCIPLNAAYNVSANSISSAMGTYGLSSMVFALLLSFATFKRQVNRKIVHMISLAAGGIGFLLMAYWTPETSAYLQLSFVLIGFSWGSILSMPYAMLSSSLPAEKMGVYMGLFNMFIVLPQIAAALGGVNWAYKTFLGESAIHTMTLAGISLGLGAVACLWIRDFRAIGRPV
jgi:maltose/moltooligosaccharide transporter